MLLLHPPDLCPELPQVTQLLRTPVASHPTWFFPGTDSSWKFKHGLDALGPLPVGAGRGERQPCATSALAASSASYLCDFGGFRDARLSQWVIAS